MRVLLLSPYPETIEAIIAGTGDAVTSVDTPITGTAPDPDSFDLAVSYGYRHIIRDEALARWEGRLINLHISLLPWNRGADPNFWAAVDGTPAGVSIHHIDAGVDTGDLIAQREVPFAPGDTLASSYTRLHAEILDLFAMVWPAIRNGTAPRIAQTGPGSSHRSADKEPLMARLPQGWDTPVSDVARLVREEENA
ncbi:MAG: formyl transferase [Alphaproteobacteria bacterium]|nr:formyl transferase [Alphaproteobacteria bacterium]